MTNHKALTPLEEARARERAWDAFLEQANLETPRPERPPLGKRTKRLMAAMFAIMRVIVLSVPFMITIVIVGAGMITADKNIAVFQQAAVHKEWAALLAVGTLAFVDFGLLYTAFVSEVDRGNAPGGGGFSLYMAGRAVVRLLFGGVSWHGRQIKPASIGRHAALSAMLMVLSITGNLYAVFYVAEMPVTQADQFVVIFKLMMGAIAPVALHYGGRDLARAIVTQQAAYAADLVSEQVRAWEARQRAAYEELQSYLESRALAQAFLAKNQLPAGADNPYMLFVLDGEGGAGQTAQIAPLSGKQ